MILYEYNITPPNTDDANTRTFARLKDGGVAGLDLEVGAMWDLRGKHAYFGGFSWGPKIVFLYQGGGKKKPYVRLTKNRRGRLAWIENSGCVEFMWEVCIYFGKLSVGQTNRVLFVPRWRSGPRGRAPGRSSAP